MKLDTIYKSTKGGKLYLYYTYDFTNAPSIFEGWIEVDTYITAVKNNVIVLDGVVTGLGATVLAPVVGLKPRVEVMEPILAVTTAEVLELRGKMDYYDNINEIDWDNNVLAEHLSENFDSYMESFRENASANSRTFLDIIETTSYSGLGTASREATKAFASRGALIQAYFEFVMLGLGGISLGIQAIGAIYDRYTNNDLEKQEGRFRLLYEKIKDEPSAQIANCIHENGLQIVPNTDNGFSTFSTYIITLTNQAKIKIKTNGSSGNANIISVEDVGTPYFNVGDIINIPKTSMGGTSGNLQIQVISLISEVDVVKNKIKQLDDQFNALNNRRRLREGVINTSELGDGLSVVYNSTLTNPETGEVLQVPTIKLNLNSAQLETINGVLNIKKYVNQDDIDTVNKLSKHCRRCA